MLACSGACAVAHMSRFSLPGHFGPSGSMPRALPHLSPAPDCSYASHLPFFPSADTQSTSCSGFCSELMLALNARSPPHLGPRLRHPLSHPSQNGLLDSLHACMQPLPQPPSSENHCLALSRVILILPLFTTCCQMALHHGPLPQSSCAVGCP